MKLFPDSHEVEYESYHFMKFSDSYMIPLPFHGFLLFRAAKINIQQNVVHWVSVKEETFCSNNLNFKYLSCYKNKPFMKGDPCVLNYGSPYGTKPRWFNSVNEGQRLFCGVEIWSLCEYSQKDTAKLAILDQIF